MRFFSNLTDLAIDDSFKNTCSGFDDSVRNSVGKLSECMKLATQLYFSKKEYSGRLKCCLFYALYNISVNASEVNPILLDFFLKVINNRISLTYKSFQHNFDDAECRAFLEEILGPSNVRRAFGELQNGRLRERETCPFEAYQKSAVSFLDFVGMTLRKGPWPEYDPMMG